MDGQYIQNKGNLPLRRIMKKPVLLRVLRQKNGSKGARTLGLPLVRRALIPAELCFHGFYYNMTGEFCNSLNFKRRWKMGNEVINECGGHFMSELWEQANYGDIAGSADKNVRR